MPSLKSSFVMATGLFALGACAPASTEPAGAPRPVAEAAADLSRVYESEELEVKPRLVNAGDVARAIQSNFPSLLRDAGVGGTVVLRAIVEKDGRTSSVEVIRSENNQMFSAPAAAVVRRMRFQPGTVDGAPVRARVEIPITFTPPR
jgi:protein TonB